MPFLETTSNLDTAKTAMPTPAKTDSSEQPESKPRPSLLGDIVRNEGSKYLRISGLSLIAVAALGIVGALQIFQIQNQQGLSPEATILPQTGTESLRSFTNVNDKYQFSYDNNYFVVTSSSLTNKISPVVYNGTYGQINLVDGTSAATVISAKLRDYAKLDPKAKQLTSKTLQPGSISEITIQYNVSLSPLVSQTYTHYYLGEKFNGKILLLDVTILGNVNFNDAIKTKYQEVFNSVKPYLAGSTSNLPATGSDTAGLDVSKAAVLGTAATVHIYNRSCVDAQFKQSSSLALVSGKTYTLCTGALGSGFYINKDGVLLTNAHVAADHPLDVAINGTISGYDQNSLASDLYQTVLTYTTASTKTTAGTTALTADNAQFMQDLIISVMVDGYQKGYLTISNPVYQNFAEAGTPFSINRTDLTIKDPSAYTTLTLVNKVAIDSIYILSYEQSTDTSKVYGVTQPDLAILQTADPAAANIFALKLADANSIIVGQPVKTVGFPGSADNRDLFSSNASTISTVTTGSVSAIKPNTSNTFNLIQIDAPISHGNSGGPIINQNGEVIGLVTYEVSSDSAADFNAGVSVAEATRFLNQAGIGNSLDSNSINLNAALDNYDKQYYKTALTQLQSVESQDSKLTASIDPVIVDTQKKIAANQDRTPVVDVGGFSVDRTQLGIVLIFSSILLFGLGTLVFNRSK